MCKIYRHLEMLNEKITNCTKCPRLVEHCRNVAVKKRKAYRDSDYWGKPVPSFGDPFARLLIMGLAPGAHGSNRTGRMFTGDASGNVLFRSLHRAGFANKETAYSLEDGLLLTDCRISAIAHCAPPGNKPNNEEVEICGEWLDQELQLMLSQLTVVVALGQMAFKGYLKSLKRLGFVPSSPTPKFGHGAYYKFDNGFPNLLCSYHPSQQNVLTGRLTQEMLDEVFYSAKETLKEQS